MTKRLCGALVLVAAALAFAACGGSSDAPATARTTAVRTASCATLGTRSEIHLQADGSMRRAVVVIPPQLANARGTAPVAIMYHGLGSSPELAERYDAVSKAATALGYVLVLPEGVGGEWWFPGFAQAASLEHGELAFFDGLVKRLTALDCVDLKDVVVAGESLGGGMAGWLACKRTDRLAGVLLVVAVHYGMPCRPSRPIPVVSVQALDDDVLPYRGGDIGYGLTQLPVEQAVAKWAEFDGCEGEPTSQRLPHDVVRMRWQGCAAPVVHYRLRRGGHTWFTRRDHNDLDANLLLAELLGLDGRAY